MKKEEISILVADDHPMLLKGLTDQLTDLGYTVLEGALNGAHALASIINFKPQLAILDIEMPLLTGFEVINKCQELSSETKFIVLTSHKEKAFVLKAKKLNISGYLLKDEPFAEIEKGISKVLEGGTYFSKVFDAVFDSEISPQLQKIKYLSPSERTIVRLVAQGKNSKDIGEMLSISHRTVEKHRANVMVKLELSTGQDALIDWALENKDILLSL